LLEKKRDRTVFFVDIPGRLENNKTRQVTKAMDKKIQIVIAVLVIADILFAYFVYQRKYGGVGDVSRVCFGNDCFAVEIAATDAEREKGLMGRKKLGAGQGMIFIYDKPGYYSFWMKNTLIPLDIVWLDKDRRVVFINENTQPCREDDCPALTPVIQAQYVFEANAGTAEKIGLQYGDRADIIWYAE
jgi:hypothetical protein